MKERKIKYSNGSGSLEEFLNFAAECMLDHAEKNNLLPQKKLSTENAQ